MNDGFFITMRRISTYSISSGVLFVLLTILFQGCGKMETTAYMSVVFISFGISVFLAWSFVRFMINKRRERR